MFTNWFTNVYQCKNYEICDTILPDWWYECKGSYLHEL
jgi:hypothetical protein